MHPLTLGFPRLLRRETYRKRCPGGIEDARGAVSYASQLRIGDRTAEDSLHHDDVQGPRIRYPGLSETPQLAV